MRKNKLERCYMCGANANSREHVPPLCLFPEKKDIASINFRQNLITVPSCDLHNSKKSKDDEFLLACLAGLVGNNSIAFIQNKTKVKRMFDRYGEHFINVISKNAKFFTIKSASGNLFPVAKGMPDVPRLIKCFKHISYGLYYHSFNRIFDGECKIIPAFLNYNEQNMRALVEVISRRYAFHEKESEMKEFGNNPLVFQHWMVDPDEFGIIGMKMTFYEGADVYVAFLPKDFVKPIGIIDELIKDKQKFVVEFPDDLPPVEFN